MVSSLFPFSILPSSIPADRPPLNELFEAGKVANKQQRNEVIIVAYRQYSSRYKVALCNVPVFEAVLRSVFKAKGDSPAHYSSKLISETA